MEHRKAYFCKINQYYDDVGSDDDDDDEDALHYDEDEFPGLRYRDTPWEESDSLDSPFPVKG